MQKEFHGRAADGDGMNGGFAVCGGGDVEDGIRLGQRVVAGVVAKRAFVAERLARVNVASAQAGVGLNGFQFGQNAFKARPIWNPPRHKCHENATLLKLHPE